MNKLKQFWSCTVLGLGLLLGGCATVSGPAVQWMTVDEQGRLAGTGFQAVDLMVACHEIDGIINAMMSTPGVLDMSIIVDPVENETRFRLPEDKFNQAIYGQLRSSAPPMSTIMKPDNSIVPQMYLMGRLQRVMLEDSREYEVLLYSYQMVDATNNEVVWEGSCEVQTYFSAVSAETMLTAEASVEK